MSPMASRKSSLFLSVLIGMYNNENILVAIDELDAVFFEHLLEKF